MNRLFLFLVSLLLTVHAMAQRVTVSGYVTDRDSGETLLSAEIICGTTGTVSDPEGRYSITLSSGDALLQYYYNGYKSESLATRLARDTTINIALEKSETLRESRVIAVSETGIRATQMGAISLPASTLQKTPVILGEPDILKTIQLLPGIQQGMDGFSNIFVRGGGSDENMFLLDGVPVYNVSHMLGVFSAFTPESVKGVTLYKGAFPAHYGGRISGVVDIRTNDGDQKSIHGAAGVGLLSGNLHLEGPIVKGKTTFSLSGRVMHTALIKPVLKLSNVGIGYSFYDVTGKVTHRFSDKDKLSASFFMGQDNFFYDKADAETMRWGNRVASLKWHHVFNGKYSLNTMASFNRFGSSAEYSSSSETARFDSYYTSLIRDWSASSELDGRISPKQHLKAGISITYHYFSPSSRFVTSSIDENDSVWADNAKNPDYNGLEAAIYAENELTVLPGWSILPGLRYVIMTSGASSYHSVEPRFSTRVSLTSGLAIKGGYARMAQYVHQLAASSIALPSDIWVPITEGIKPVTSDIGSIGVYYDGLTGWAFSLEGYFKLSNNIIEYRDGASMYGSMSGWESLVEMGLSRSRGVELYVEKTSSALSGWVSYTLSKTERCFPSGYINAGNWFPYKYDRRHVLHLYADYSFSKTFDISASWSFMSGAWLTLPERSVAYMDSSNAEDAYVSYYYPSRNNYQLPPTHLLNVNLNLKKSTKHGCNYWSFCVYNVYNAMNPNLVYMYREQTGDNNQDRIIVKKTTYLPILPSFKYTYKF